MTPEHLSTRGRIGGLTTHSKHDSHVIARRARNGLMAKYEREVDPDGVLSDDERRQRAERAHKAHMSRIALISAQKRKRKAVT